MFELITAAIIFSFLVGTAIYFFKSSWMQVIIYPALIFLAYVTMFEMPSIGKPLEWEWREDISLFEVVSYTLDENEAIYVWIREPGTVKPRYYILPWNLDQALQLENARKRQELILKEGGIPTDIYLAIEGFDNIPTFWDAPQPPDLPKEPLEFSWEE